MSSEPAVELFLADCDRLVTRLFDHSWSPVKGTALAILKSRWRSSRGWRSKSKPCWREGYEGEMSINPVQAAPRCTARSRRTGKRCRAPAVRGWKVCRMHGARGGAPKGKRNGNHRHGARSEAHRSAAGPEGERNGNYKHGARSKEMIQLWKFIKSLK